MKRFVFCAVVTVAVGAGSPVWAADVILNEYNACGDSNFLQGTGSDSYWGRIEGNGGDWFEMAVITDHLDMRGWQLVISDGTGSPPQTLTLTNNAVWSNLRSGTIITVSEDLGNNVSDYIPALGKWWLNVKASDDSDGTYITAANFRVNNTNWQLTIKDSVGTVKFGPSGEGVMPTGGVGNDEVCKLQANPSAAITPLSAYSDGSTSTFGSPNSWSGGASNQDFSALRSIVPYTQLTSVRINEVLTHSDPDDDWIELYNTTGSPVDVGNWYVSDKLNDLTRYQIPAGTIIPANGYLVLHQADLGFGLDSANGDDVVLSAADGLGTMTGGRDYISFGASQNGVTFGRYPNGTGPIYSMNATQGAENSYPIVGPIVINELMYHPPDGPGGVDDVDHEFVELANVTGSPATLYTHFPVQNETHGWKLTGAVNFTFAIGTTIPANGFIVVVSFDPVLDPVKLASFLTTYDLSPTAQIVGPYTGKLSNSGDTVRLLKPDTPQPPPESFTPYVLAEEVAYLDHAPWPTAPDGVGPTLSRIGSTLIGNDALNWRASANFGGTPGCPNGFDVNVAGDIDGSQTVDSGDVSAFVSILLGLSDNYCQTSRADFNNDGVVNGNDVPGMTDALIP